jgi:N utilization substance protein B
VSLGPRKARTRARSRALEFLYGLAHTHEDYRDALPRFWETFETNEAARAYAETLIAGAEEEREDLDAAIDGVLQDWNPGRVGRVERAILRIALYEMRYEPDVPIGVAINEAIELAKAYGSDESPGFVNAVLDRLKDETSQPASNE